MSLYLNNSQARRNFKLLLGQANHLVVTILVGLHAVEEQIVTQPPAELHAAWNPADQVKSARRSRKMVLEMSLVRAVDALDAYITWSRRKPYLIQNIELQKAIDQSHQSVLNKFLAFTQYHSSLNSVLNALTEVTIAWRNRSVHSLADNDVEGSKWELLRDNAHWIAQEFRGLDIERLMKDFTNDKPPTFKETASLIHSVQETVESMENAQFGQLDSEQYLKQLVCARLDASVKGATEEQRRRQRKTLIGSIWGQEALKRTTRVMSFLKNGGLTDVKKYDYAVTFDDGLLGQIISMSPETAFNYFFSTHPEATLDV